MTKHFEIQSLGLKLTAGYNLLNVLISTRSERETNRNCDAFSKSKLSSDVLLDCKVSSFSQEHTIKEQ